MNPDRPERLDQILSTEDQLVPTSGFLAAVMDRVHDESVAPPPLAFPWKRLLPGLLLALAVFVWAAVAFVRPLFAGLRTLALAAPPLPAILPHALHSSAWAVCALAVSFLACVFARRLAGGSGLF